MLKQSITVLMSLFALAAPAAYAGSVNSDAVLGAVIGSAAGAAIGSAAGDRNGAIIGAGIGGAVGATLSTQHSYRPQPRYVRERVVYRDMPPPGWRHRHRHGGDSYAYYGRPYYPDRYADPYYRRYYAD